LNRTGVCGVVGAAQATTVGGVTTGGVTTGGVKTTGGVTATGGVGVEPPPPPHAANQAEMEIRATLLFIIFIKSSMN